MLPHRPIYLISHLSSSYFIFIGRDTAGDPCRVHLMDVPEKIEKALNASTQTYVGDAKAMAVTPADIKELPNAYVFIIDMPEIRSRELKAQVKDDNVLVISGKHKHDDEKEEGVKYLLMERQMGKLMRKFTLPDNADIDAVSAICQDGVLTVTIKKHSLPEPKKPRSIEVKVA